MIFEGKTDKVHPTHPKPDDCIWAHTTSHWQSVETYAAVIKDIIIPYKNGKILELNLPESQVTILKHDLHFTHKDESILALMRENNILPLFVPAGCTDVMQECDTVVNKPFKNGVRESYRDHMDALLNQHRLSGNPASTFNTRLTMSALKPHITRFVQSGIAAISTPEMKATIANAFANDGLFAYMRSPEVQLSIGLKGVVLVIGGISKTAKDEVICCGSSEASEVNIRGVLNSILAALISTLFFATSLKLFDDERSLFLLLQ